jgi:hypothetical protein
MRPYTEGARAVNPTRCLSTALLTRHETAGGPRLSGLDLRTPNPLLPPDTSSRRHQRRGACSAHRSATPLSPRPMAALQEVLRQAPSLGPTASRSRESGGLRHGADTAIVTPPPAHTVTRTCKPSWLCATCHHPALVTTGSACRGLFARVLSPTRRSPDSDPGRRARL